ncbi:MAG: chemotaxis protein CheC [Oscillospiraceae bacterium]|nr:chemotaxis protein CheC [Oscillospiraceae bacterium]
MHEYSMSEKNNIMAFLERNPDLFKEMGNIGMGHACTAVSQLLGIKVNRSIPAVWTLTKEEAAGYFELFEGGSIGVRLTLHEDVDGSIIHIVSLPFAATLIEKFFFKEVASIEEIDEVAMSVVQEMTNITTGSFVNSISSMTGLFIDISTPHFCSDLKKEALIDVPEKMIVVENRFLINMGSISSELIFMPKRESLGLIAEKLCQRYGIEIPDDIV